MVEDVTVEHPHPRAFVEVKAHGRVDRHVDGVSPLPNRGRNAVDVENLKEDAVQVERWSHVNVFLTVHSWRSPSLLIRCTACQAGTPLIPIAR
jgi:hypothetical protein